jgi:phage terminase large subunit
MLACVWVATDERGRSYVYRELKASGLVVSDAAAAIRAHTPDGESITVTYAPPDMWSRQKDTGKTMAELFALRGVPVVRAGNNRIQGHMQIKEGLRDMDDGAPGLMFFSTCREAIADISAITASERNPNDCAVTPHEVTHMVDAVRYFAVSRAVSYSADEASPSGGYEGFLLGGAPSGGYLLY